jgi:hypothetical protein
MPFPETISAPQPGRSQQVAGHAAVVNHSTKRLKYLQSLCDLADHSH